jgi:hypothetical protein
MAVIAFLFGSWKTFLFYVAFGIFLWWWSHRFHLAKARILKTFITLGILVPVLYFFYWVFNDLLSLLVCVFYALSFVIAGVLYFYHVKRELAGVIHRSFSRTFLVIFYSHMIALAAASLLAYLLPKVLIHDSFVGIIDLILAWVFPTLLLYFFLTKFLYLKFFDSVHIRRDILQGLAHGAAYALIFIILLVLAYVLTAIQFAGMERASYETEFTHITTRLSNVDFDLSMAASGTSKNFLGFEITGDVLSLADNSIQDVAAVNEELTRSFSFGDYMSDNYCTLLVANRVEVSKAASEEYGINEVKSDLIREYRRVRWFEREGLYDDSTTTIEAHLASLSAYLDGNYVPYVEPYRFALLRDKISSSADSYSALLEDGDLLDFNLVYRPEMSVLAEGDSRFSRAFYDVVYHTRVFRDFMVLVFNSITLQVEDTLEPYSKVLRYRVLRSNIEATLSLE